ncbi:MAG: IS66 family transposase [Dehalococcoidia bacterium]
MTSHPSSIRVEPTNNRAERILRPAVIARKVSQCSKTDDGATAPNRLTLHCSHHNAGSQLRRSRSA